jgi:hypothetical protein
MLNVYALCGGLIDLDLSGFFCDVAPGRRMTVPVICFLIAHPRGNVLVDTGVHRQALTDPVGRLGERRAGLFRLRSAPGDEVVSQLALLGLAPSDIRYVVNSHFHFDHCGGNEFFPRSTFLVQRPEMEAARQVLAGAQIRYSPSPIDFDLPLEYQLVDGEHDIFGDAQVVLLPTYGHTPVTSQCSCATARARSSCWPRMPATRGRTWTATCCPTSSGTRPRCRARSPGYVISGTAGAPPSSTVTTPPSGRSSAGRP